MSGAAALAALQNGHAGARSEMRLPQDGQEISTPRASHSLPIIARSRRPKQGSLDYFVVESISVGGSLLYISRTTKTETDAGSADGPTTSTFGIAPRVGYAMAFDETFSIWPRAGITYYSTKVETPAATGGNDTTDTTSGLDLTIEVPVGISPMEHFAILAGPYLDLGLSGTVEQDNGTTSQKADQKTTSYGLTVGMLGYF